jgi:uncharacterized membrane protein YkoI
MNQKYTLTLAAAITAFILVVGGGIANGLAHPAVATYSVPPVGDIQALYVQREAAYQAQIDKANKALAEAYAQQGTGSTANLSKSASMSDVALTPQDAMSTAIIAAPGATVLSMPELVNYQGVVAYEVKLNLGVVYIDASNGTMLYNGAVNFQASRLASYSDDYYENDGD